MGLLLAGEGRQDKEDVGMEEEREEENEEEEKGKEEVKVEVATPQTNMGDACECKEGGEGQEARGN